VIVVVGHEAEAVKEAIGDDVEYALQAEQRGTGHATMQAMPLVKRPNILLLPGDAPLVTAQALGKLLEAHSRSHAAATLLTAVLDDPASYGRIVRAPDGSVLRIVEAKDASPEILALTEVGTSIYCFDTELLRSALSKLGTDNVQGEYYLTDTIEILRREGHTVAAEVAENAHDTLGVNTQEELAMVAEIMQRRMTDNVAFRGAN
jgi:bifunctional UDP-N-acetylglucosamine pyrophosphorylase/glucosamine-1-phosphate N-acetyltransferase